MHARCLNLHYRPLDQKSSGLAEVANNTGRLDAELVSPPLGLEGRAPTLDALFGRFALADHGRLFKEATLPDLGHDAVLLHRLAKTLEKALERLVAISDY